jgi:hypothetical protein
MTYKTALLDYLKLNNEQLRVSYGKDDNNIFVTPRHMSPQNVKGAGLSGKKKKTTENVTK